MYNMCVPIASDTRIGFEGLLLSALRFIGLEVSGLANCNLRC